MNTFWFLLVAMCRGRLAALSWLSRTHPEASRLALGRRRGILLNTPELVEELLVHRNDDFQKGPALRIHSRPLLGNGLLTSEGEEHRKHRRLVAPAFAHQRVFRYAAVMSQLSRATVDSWKDGAVVPMHREMTRLTLNIVGRTLFDVDLLEDADEIGRHIGELARFATEQTRSFHPLPADSTDPRNLRANRAIERLNQTIYGLIEDRRRSGEDKGDLLSMLLLARDEDGNSLTDQQVRDEAMTLFLAGHETTANAMTWALYLLGRNPEVQRELQTQIVAAAGNQQVQFEDLPHIPLVLQVFKEALRLFPPAYIVVREALHDGRLSDRVPFRKGELVAVCEWTLHRNARYFPDPDRFDPNRFTLENEAKIHRFAYFPFGAGRRICIGNQFALMEGQIILATIFQRYTVAPVETRAMATDPLITLRPKGASLMRVSEARN